MSEAPAETQTFETPAVDAADIAGVFDLGGFVAEAEPAAPAAPETPAAAPTPAPAPAAPAAPTPAAAPAPAPTPAPAADPSASPLAAPVTPAPAQSPTGLDPEAEERLRVRNLEASLAAANAENERLRQAPQAPAPAAQPQQPGTGTVPLDADGIPQAALTIPNDVVQAIFNEDPAIAASGLNHLVNSLTKVIYQRVYTDMNAGLAAIRSERQMEVQDTSIAQQRKAFQDDYYATFPSHNKPVFATILQQESMRLAAEYPNAPVDENWRNALGARVQAVINELTGQPAPTPTPAATPAPTPTPSARPAAMLPTDGNRGGVLVPGTEPDAVNSQDNIMSTFTSD